MKLKNKDLLKMNKKIINSRSKHLTKSELKHILKVYMETDEYSDLIDSIIVKVNMLLSERK